MVITGLEGIKLGKLQDQKIKDEYVERSKDSLGEIKQYECLELDELWEATKSVLVDEPKKVADNNVMATEYMIDDGSKSEIVMCEIMKALKCMKGRKAAGYDRVSSDVLRDGGGSDQTAERRRDTHAGEKHRD
ncbi:hypothetical protein EVAR_92728_1 [Eumeta japonica]|uniref:Uncharacterized protein n=1 Tax=Eumeta variegata TaxID=151549 RepID=A0A4C1T0M4_EUMVA|nr:hypothetical protein EVAR_92728_1 [Eumeta japonica]